MIRLGIYIFNEVEVLDLAGPFEVFSLAEQDNKRLFNVITISQDGQAISARNGLKIIPDFGFSNCPSLDWLVIPGGYGAEEIEINKPEVLDWIKKLAKEVKILASICTGAFLLAKTGLLEGLYATTHWMDLDRLENEYPGINVQRNTKFVDQGNILTSGGISAGINLSFHLLKREFGSSIAKETAKRMEYDIDLSYV